MRRRRPHFWLSVLAVSCAAIPMPAAAQTAPRETAAVGDGVISPVSQFRLRAGDALRMAVHNEPGLTGEYPVLEDGTVLLPLVGLVHVAGTEFGDVVRRVRAAYAAELLNATLVLQPLVRVRVLGEVRLPGLYLVDATYGMRDVVAEAGGTTPSAVPNRVLLVREGRAQSFHLERGPAGEQPVVKPGDEIIVPRRSWVRENLPILVGAGTSVVAAALTAWLVR
jgi:polysaccharide biosynthesis/export protein